MKRCVVASIGCLLLGFRAGAQAPVSNPAAVERSERMILEEKHFVQSLATVYNPALWISYRDGLYFVPKNEAQQRQIEVLKVARANYVALTNREARYALAAAVIAQSGIGPRWQRKLLLPYSDTNQNLTPTLSKPVQVVTGYKLLKTFENGDAIIEAQATLCLVLNFFRTTDDPSVPEVWLVKEGEKAYATAPGEYQRVEAFARVELSGEETDVFNRVVAACQKRIAALTREIGGFGAREDFENSVRRATDSNPFLQFQVAKAYLEGKGTAKDEQLGLEWMNKAARNGSGDAKSYLESPARKTP